MGVRTGERFGYVRRFSYPGEPWHIVDVPPTAEEEVEGTPALCGSRPWLGYWGTICAYADHLKVCKRCERVWQRYEAAG